MAGHSQFKNIMYRKGAQDAKRAKLFSKLIREVTVAAKTGLPDPDGNPRLRAAVSACRVANMPKDNIERAIKRASDKSLGSYKEILWVIIKTSCFSYNAFSNSRQRSPKKIRKRISYY